MVKTEPRLSDPEPLSYEAARDSAGSNDWQQRRDLALRQDVPPEILYFLASDSVSKVRCAVAGNPATPAKGNLLLAGDGDLAVRTELATKIGHYGRFVGISKEQARSKEIMEEVMSLLAGDHAVRIRAVISNALKDADDIDPAVIHKLAHDSQIAVAAPILQYSPMLWDEDLLELISAAPAEGVLAAIARRAYVDARVTAEIVASSDPPAITHLLKNANVNLQEDTLDALINGASTEPSWQEPLVFRRELSEAALDRVVEMAAPHVLDHILLRHDLPAQTASAVAKAIEESLRQRSPGETAMEGRAGKMVGPAVESHYQPALDKMRALQADEQLDEMALTVALLTDHSEDLVAGLALLANVGVQIVLEIAEAQSARAICALAWKAGLSAAFAVELQMRFGNVPLDQVQKPAEDDGYSLGDAEMTWQLDMFRSGQEKKSEG
jgi:hypothetical protein